MSKRIAIIQGHPDPRGGHLGHALAQGYAEGGERAGNEIKVIQVAALQFPLVHTKEEWETAVPPEAIGEAQRTIGWADHLVFFYPLWLGSMPAILKGFLEQVFRPQFAIGKQEGGKMGKKLLTGKSARIVVTMGMPALVYRWYFGAHSLKALERNILGFSGVGPIRASVFGLIEARSTATRDRWLAKMRALGGKAL